MRALMLVLALLVGFAASPMAADDDLTALRQTHALLQAEYELAKTAKPYLVIDLPAQQLLFRVSGVTVANWTIDAYRRWGHPATPTAALLVAKHSLDEPEREVQVVTLAPATTAAADDQSAAELKAFELADMPTNYRLQFDNGLQISVRPTPGGWSGHLRRTLATPFWYLSRPLISDWNFLRGSTYNELALSLSEQDARKLYWACTEGCPCLLRTPEGVVASPDPQPPGTNQ